jgi:hypothetical protein
MRFHDLTLGRLGQQRDRGIETENVEKRVDRHGNIISPWYRE